MQKLMIVLLISMLCCACEINVNTSKDSGGIDIKPVSTLKEQNGTEIRNNIELKTIGVKVKRAYLVLGEGERAPDDNVMKVGQKINLVFDIEDGWTVENGKSYIGGTQKVVTDDGSVVLHVEDVFAAYTNAGFPEKACKSISLDVTITKANPKINYYTTTFRVWDKKGTGEISGSYKFYIKQ